MISSDVLKKTASVLRELDLSNKELVAKEASLKKEAAVSRMVLSMLKDGNLDVDEIDTKIAEFNADPELLNKTASFYDRSVKSAGQIKTLPFEVSGMDADSLFMANLQS